MSNFYKIECLDCGINADLLTDVFHRIICRECLNKNEFNEVENEIYSEGDSEKESERNRNFLHNPNISVGNNRDIGLLDVTELLKGE